jgi:hypothetical protein
MAILESAIFWIVLAAASENHCSDSTEIKTA